LVVVVVAGSLFGWAAREVTELVQLALDESMCILLPQSSFANDCWLQIRRFVKKS
jgi:hypothetical protein